MYSPGSYISAKNKLPSAQNGEIVHSTDIEGRRKGKWKKTATSRFSQQHSSPLEDDYPASGDETDYEATVGGQTLVQLALQMLFGSLTVFVLVVCWFTWISFPGAL